MKKIFLIGSPNSGKTTVFNWLTGKKQKVVNYPGSTVEVSVGESLPAFGDSLQIYDSPGTYSLTPKSLEEEVTLKMLYGPEEDFAAVVVVVDSTQVERQVPLILQLQEQGFPVVVALTMGDLLDVNVHQGLARALAERLKVSVIGVDGRLGGGLTQLVQAIHDCQKKTPMSDRVSWGLEKYQSTFKEFAEFALRVFQADLSPRQRTDRLDRIFLHPFFGVVIFCLSMVALFSSIFWLAAPLMDLVDQFFVFSVELIKTKLPEGLLQQFVSDGILTSVGAVLIFVPQILILFLGISWLEDTGYLARSAVIMDRPLSYFGLTGKSFVPMLSGFACAVPAVLAARTISSQKARWLTVFIIPFMTCSARLPVYALLLAFLFYQKSSVLAGLSLAALYVGAIAVSLVASKLLSKLLNHGDRDIFLMEMPLYRRPTFRRVISQSFRRTQHYVVKSGPIIFVMAVLVWLMSTFPHYELPGEQRLSQSYAGQAGKILEPIFEPMGADWRVGVSLISAFAAREVFVSSLAVVLNVADGQQDSEEALQESLLTTMREARTSGGDRLFTTASVVALLVFFMVALQCMSTVGVVYREMGSWRYAVGQLAVMNLVAYGLAVILYQVLRFIGY